MTKKYQIAIVPGDGIGHEIVPASLDVLQAATGNRIEPTAFPFGAGHYQQHGRFMPEGALEELLAFDAILFGAVGLPEVDDTLPAKEYTFKVRCEFHQYVNFRPCKRFAGIPGPLRSEADFDFVIIRENNEGEFILTGSEHHLDAPEGFATQMSVFTRRGITQVARFAFGLANRRGKKLTNVTKSNTLIHSLKYWDRVIEEVHAEFPDVTYEKMYVDAAAANMVLRPERFDVILTTNMIGDILSDLGGALVGSLGLASSGNINPEKDFPSMFEPIHGSAPDIAGQGIANPIGSIESGALMLEHLGEADAAQRIHRAVAETLAAKIWTPDLGGTATTREITAAVIERIES
jgi:tartrate dehydrogenase/decarboxylase/D-malate dehydrogenase